MNTVLEIDNILQICSWLGTLVRIHISLKTEQQMLLSWKDLQYHYLQIRQCEYRKFYTFGNWQSYCLLIVIYQELILGKTG